jgi:pilus assembly protein Flp/PilA
MVEYGKHLLRAVAARYEGLKGEEGQGLVEYGLIIVFVSIAAIVGLTALGVNLNDLFQNLSGDL